MWKRIKKFCTCGNKIDDPDVVPEARYTWNNWLLLIFISYTARPKEIIFRCLHCGGIVERTKDLFIREKYNDNAEILRVRETNKVNIHFGKSDYDIPLDTNVTGKTLEPQTEKSLQGSLITLYLVIGSIVFTAIVLLVLLTLTR